MGRPKYLPDDGDHVLNLDDFQPPHWQGRSRSFDGSFFLIDLSDWIVHSSFRQYIMVFLWTSLWKFVLPLLHILMAKLAMHVNCAKILLKFALCRSVQRVLALTVPLLACVACNVMQNVTVMWIFDAASFKVKLEWATVLVNSRQIWWVHCIAVLCGMLHHFATVNRNILHALSWHLHHDTRQCTSLYGTAT